jgi:hypothetical protein
MMRWDRKKRRKGITGGREEENKQKHEVLGRTNCLLSFKK